MLVVVFDGSRVIHCFYSLLSSSFKMASNRAKWSKNAHSYISGTQGVWYSRCANTQALVVGHQMSTPSKL